MFSVFFSLSFLLIFLLRIMSFYFAFLCFFFYLSLCVITLTSANVCKISCCFLLFCRLLLLPSGRVRKLMVFSSSYIPILVSTPFQFDHLPTFVVLCYLYSFLSVFINRLKSCFVCVSLLVFYSLFIIMLFSFLFFVNVSINDRVN